MSALKLMLCNFSVRDVDAGADVAHELIGGETNIRAYSRCADWPPAPPERVNVDITAQQSTRP